MQHSVCFLSLPSLVRPVCCSRSVVRRVQPKSGSDHELTGDACSKLLAWTRSGDLFDPASAAKLLQMLVNMSSSYRDPGKYCSSVVARKNLLSQRHCSLV